MSATICGHERDVLIAQLRCLTAAPNDFLRVSADAWKVLDVPAFNARKQEFARAFDALNDPAKLAELMASALRERGLIALATLNDNWWDTFNSIPQCPNYMVIWNSTRIHMHQIEKPGTSDVWPLELPQARAALLRILELPQGATTEDAMGTLTHAYADPDELLNTIPATKSLARRQNESNPGRRR